MTIVSMLAQQRRLGLLCVASVALHLLALWVIADGPQRSARTDAAPRIAVTLLPALVPVRQASPAAVAPPLAQPLAQPMPRVAAQRPPSPAPAAAPTQAAGEAAAPAAPVDGAGWSAVAAGAEDTPVQMPGRYRVRLPPAALLSFALTRSGAGAAPAAAGAALIDWRIGADSYSLRVEGVAGVLYSRGGVGDAGIAPASASETLADGDTALTSFDEAARQIGFSGAARSRRLLAGSQDRASLLMQLAGIGLAEPDQVKDVLEFYVGGSGDAGVVRFQVLGAEELDSALGKLASMHLVQLVGPGQARLEVWLAPQRHWLPVQLRVTAPDGSVMTQLVTAISER
jgi:hypothetical protein